MVSPSDAPRGNDPAPSQAADPTGRRPAGATAALMLICAVVLADSSVVTLALPSILRQFDATVGHVAWVLIAFNVALAAAALPASLLIRRAARVEVVTAAGLIVFAVASAVCGVAGSLDLLVAARVVQALGGALVVTGALELLVHQTGSRSRGSSLWAVAGVAGTAIGPMAGGVLTEAISWQSIFFLQVPLAAIALPVLLGSKSAQASDATIETAGFVEPTARARIAVDATLALLSAALTAALFLVVVLLIEGWRRSPITAALTVTVLPVAAIAVRPLAARLALSLRTAGASGAVLIAGGLAALAYLPAANLAWMIAPQILIGVGIGLTIEPLTAQSIRDGASAALLGGRNITARHLGIVLGLALLTPIFTHGLERAQAPARGAVIQLVVDAPLSISTKIDLAGNLEHAIDGQGERIPDLAPAFEATSFAASERPEGAHLQGALNDQLDRAATHAFRGAFVAAALLALLALLPALLIVDAGSGRAAAASVRGTVAGRLTVVAALALAAALVGTHLASGGVRFVPTAVVGACVERPLPQRTTDPDLLTQSIVLLGVQHAACRFGVPRDQLLIALPSAASRGLLLKSVGKSDDDLAAALKVGLVDGVSRLDRAGQLPTAEDLITDYAEPAGVPSFIVDGLKQIPPSLVNRYVAVGPIVRAAINGLDGPTLVKNLGDLPALQKQVLNAIAKTTISRITDQLKHDVPSRLGSLLGLG